MLLQPPATPSYGGSSLGAPRTYPGMIVSPLFFSFSFLFFSFLFFSFSFCTQLWISRIVFVWVITFKVKIWYLLSRVGCDHPCVLFYVQLWISRAVLILVVCSCTYVCCLGMILFSVYLCQWLLAFCFVGVMAFSLTMRTL